MHLPLVLTLIFMLCIVTCLTQLNGILLLLYKLWIYEFARGMILLELDKEPDNYYYINFVPLKSRVKEKPKKQIRLWYYILKETYKLYALIKEYSPPVYELVVLFHRSDDGEEFTERLDSELYDSYKHIRQVELTTSPME